MKKRVFALLLAAVMLSLHLTTFAAGWEQLQSGEWMYYNADGSYKTDAWIGNYYVDSSGCMLRIRSFSISFSRSSLSENVIVLSDIA